MPVLPDSIAPSVVMYQVGGRTYPLKHVPNCLVCNSRHRLEVEQGLLNGRTYASIVHGLPEGSGLTRHNVRDHYAAGHLPAAVEPIRAIIDERARIRGMSVDAAAGNLVDHVALAEVVVTKTFEAIANGTLAPTVRDGIRAATLLHNIGVLTDDASQDDLTAAFVVYMEAARGVMTEEQWNKFGISLASNPVLQGLRLKASERQHEVYDADPPPELESRQD